MRVQCIQRSIPSFRSANINDPEREIPVSQPDSMSFETNLNKMPQHYGSMISNSPDPKKFFVCKEEIRIPNLLTLTQDIHIDSSSMMKDGKLSPLNPSGLHVLREDGDETFKITVENDGHYPIIVATVKKGTDLPELTYKQGKFMPELTVKHPALNGSRAKMLAGSELISENFSILMPGEIRLPDSTITPIKPNQGIAFKGHITVSTLKNEEVTRETVNLFLNGGFTKDVIRGKYADEVIREQPSIVIPAGGFGERFYNLTRDKLNKPAYYLPTDKNYRIMGTTLSMAAAAGVLEGDGKDTVTYLSQSHEIKGDDVINTRKYSTDGGAITEALINNDIPNDKDMIVLNADIFTNADITRAYHALKSIPDAALIIPYYPVNASRAQSLGLLGIADFKGGHNEVSSFAEKTKYINNPPKEPNREDFNTYSEYAKKMEEFKKNMASHITAKISRDPNGETYYANPGIYLFSKECIPIIKKMQEEAGFGNDVVPKITELCQQGKIKNAEGVALKVYTLPLQRVDGQNAYWDDIGTAEAYMKVVRDVAYETTQKGCSTENKFYGVPNFILNDFKNNVDSQTHIVYQSPESKANFENFRAKVGIKKVQGNIYVVD